MTSRSFTLSTLSVWKSGLWLPNVAWLALRGASAGGFVFSTRGLTTWARARLSRCLLVVLTRQPCASWSLLPGLVPSSVCRHDGQQGSQQVSQSSERYKEGRWPLVTGKHSRSAFTNRMRSYSHPHPRVVTFTVNGPLIPNSRQGHPHRSL